MLQQASRPDFDHLNQLAEEALSQHRIPRIIHFCFVNWRQMEDIYYPILKTWIDNLPGYTFVNWTPEILDHIPFTRQCLKDKAWAFYADYARVYGTYNYGGFYLDVDAYVYQSFDSILDLPYCFDIEMSYIINTRLEAAVFGVQPKFFLFADVLKQYRRYSWLRPADYKHVIAPNLWKAVFLRHGFDVVEPYISSLDEYRRLVTAVPVEESGAIYSLDGTFFSQTNTDLPNCQLGAQRNGITEIHIAPYAFTSHQFFTVWGGFYGTLKRNLAWPQRILAAISSLRKKIRRAGL